MCFGVFWFFGFFASFMSFLNFISCGTLLNYARNLQRALQHFGSEHPEKLSWSENEEPCIFMQSSTHISLLDDEQGTENQEIPPLRPSDR